LVSNGVAIGAAAVIKLDKPEKKPPLLSPVAVSRVDWSVESSSIFCGRARLLTAPGDKG
jgi:hypothetical protein